MQKTSSTPSFCPTQLEADVVERLLSATRAGEGAERRAFERHPLFAPVTLRPVDMTSAHISAFSREISQGGVGLLHYLPLKSGAIYRLSMQQGDAQLETLAEVVWCRAAGEGWYMSGCRFVS